MTTLSKKEQTHLRILDSAAAMIRQHGFEALAVAAVMKQTGLTHGGFYAHFANRDALLAEALTHAGRQSQQKLQDWLTVQTAAGQAPLAAFIDLYLSSEHRAACWQGDGCPLAALGSELFRLDAVGRQVADNGISRYLDWIQQLSGGELSRERAFLLLASLSGTLQLCRALPDENAALLLLDASRQQLLSTYAADNPH